MKVRIITKDKGSCFETRIYAGRKLFWIISLRPDETWYAPAVEDLLRRADIVEYIEI